MAMSVRSFLYLAFFWNLVLPAVALVHEKLNTVPSGWNKVSDAGDTEPIVLSVALHHQNIENLESKLFSISTPGSPEYRKYLDHDQLKALFPAANSAPVVSWLKGAGVQNVHSTGEAVNFATNVGTANKLLSTKFAHFENNGVSKLRTTQYSIPDHLTGHIDLISPTTYFSKPIKATPIEHHYPRRTSPHTPASVKRSAAPSCEKSITPSCVKQLYNVGNYTVDVKAGSRVGFGSFLNESAQYSDLYDYEDHFKIPRQSFSVELINGGINSQDGDPEGEANLDVQNIIGVSHPLPVVEYITGGLA